MPTRLRTQLAQQLVVLTSCASLSTPVIAAPCIKARAEARAPALDARAEADTTAGVTGRIRGAATDAKTRVEGALPDVEATARVDGADIDARATVDAKLPDIDATAQVDGGTRRTDADDNDLTLKRPPIPKALWAGLGVTAGTALVIFGTSMGLLGNLRGKMRANVVAGAKLSLSDADPNNDIDLNGDICTQARGGATSNPAVANMCDLGDLRRRAVIGTGITAGLLVGTMIVFAAVIGVRRRKCDDKDDRTARRSRFGMAFAPQWGGGMLVSQLRF